LGKARLPAELPVVATEILARAPPNGKSRLLYVHEQLRALLRSA
jgi:hypothetical protein